MAAGKVDRRAAAFLLYHAVVGAAGEGDRFAITAARFRDHLDAICAARAVKAVYPATLRAWRSGTSGGCVALLGFDDGGRSDYERAFPLLAERGLPGVFFVNTATVGRPGYVSWSELREMAHAGMEIESHGDRHEALTRLSPARLAESLSTSRHMLQQRLGTPVQYIAAPYGLWDRRVLEAALCAGYSALCTSRPGLARAADAVLPRIAAGGGISVVQLQGWCRGRRRNLLWRAGRDRLLWLPRQILLRCRPGWPEPPLAASGHGRTASC